MNMEGEADRAGDQERLQILLHEVVQIPKAYEPTNKKELA